MMRGDNIIVRYMRFRMGDKNQKGEWLMATVVTMPLVAPETKT
jgi:hypothetical protein